MIKKGVEQQPIKPEDLQNYTRSTKLALVLSNDNNLREVMKKNALTITTFCKFK